MAERDTTKPWDKTVKWLVRRSAQALVSFLVDGGVYIGDVERELQIPKPSLSADSLCKVMSWGKPMVLHVEFRRNHDTTMGERLWRYNALVHIHTDLPVYSVVIYLVKDAPLVQSPYVITLPNGEPTQRLDFATIKMWEIPAEVFEQEELTGLLPLLPLTKNGKTHETVERMITGLKDSGRRDLLVLGYAFSSLVFTADGDAEWLKERFDDMHDILSDTWVFQEIIKEGLEKGEKQGLEIGLEKGEKKGLEKGLEQGLEQGLGEALLQIVELRFPALLGQAKQAVEQQTSVEQVRTLFNKVCRANTIEDAEAVLQVREVNQ